MTNPYAPPQAGVDDIPEPQAFAVPADRGTRLGAAILDSVVFVLAVYLPLIVTLFSTARMEMAPPRRPTSSSGWRSAAPSWG